jgi:hypothetical protein
MASFTVGNIPDAVVPDLIAAIAPTVAALDERPAMRAVAQKVLNGETTTAAEKSAVGEAFAKIHLKSALVELLAQRAAESVRSNKNDPAIAW